MDRGPHPFPDLWIQRTSVCWVCAWYVCCSLPFLGVMHSHAIYPNIPANKGESGTGINIRAACVDWSKPDHFKDTTKAADFPKFCKFLLQAGQMLLQECVEESPFAKRVPFLWGEKGKKPSIYCFGKPFLLICVPASLPQTMVTKATLTTA